jgi:hypothetical protein
MGLEQNGRQGNKMQASMRVSDLYIRTSIALKPSIGGIRQDPSMERRSFIHAMHSNCDRSSLAPLRQAPPASHHIKHQAPSSRDIPSSSDKMVLYSSPLKIVPQHIQPRIREDRSFTAFSPASIASCKQTPVASRLQTIPVSSQASRTPPILYSPNPPNAPPALHPLHRYSPFPPSSQKPSKTAVSRLPRQSQP